METLRGKFNHQLKFNSLRISIFLLLPFPLSLSVCPRQIPKRDRNTPFFLIDSYNPLTPQSLLPSIENFLFLLFSKVKKKFPFPRTIMNNRGRNPKPPPPSSQRYGPTHCFPFPSTSTVGGYNFHRSPFSSPLLLLSENEKKKPRHPQLWRGHDHRQVKQGCFPNEDANRRQNIQFLAESVRAEIHWREGGVIIGK